MNTWIKAVIVIVLVAAVSAVLVLKPTPQVPSPNEVVPSSPTQTDAPIEPASAEGIPQLLDFGADT